MKKSFELIEFFSVTPSLIYEAWLDSEEHAKMTGGKAKCSNIIDDMFTAWDGYISGKNIALMENKEIVQTWRTTDFKDNEEDSKLIIKLQKLNNGCQLTLSHNNIPIESSDYKKGWNDHYFIPMQIYFKTKQ